MKKILLCCCAGMSTSLLVTRMEAEAKKRGLDIKIWACSEKVFEEEFNKEPADCVLVGPQIRYLLNTIKKQANGTPVELIDMRIYGMMDGAKVLDLGLNTIEKAGK